jgi:hypothetical protein
MNTNGIKPRAARGARRLSAVTACGLFATLALGAWGAAAQDCPNVRNFGERAAEKRREGETLLVRVQGLYFVTEDKNTFLPEVEGRRWNPAFVTLSTEAFSDKLAQLIARGEAAVNERRTGSLLLGDTAALGRGPRPLTRDASFLGLAPAAPGATQVEMLDRYTNFSVARGPDEPFYRLRLLSWFVEARPDGGGRMTVDVDLGTFLRPGETQIVKFLSDFEVKRTGSARAYLALSLVPLVNEGEWSSTRTVGQPARGN